jgi:hypothetical protein
MKQHRAPHTSADMYMYLRGVFDALRFPVMAAFLHYSPSVFMQYMHNSATACNKIPSLHRSPGFFTGRNNTLLSRQKGKVKYFIHKYISHFSNNRVQKNVVCWHSQLDLGTLNRQKQSLLIYCLRQGSLLSFRNCFHDWELLSIRK